MNAAAQRRLTPVLAGIAVVLAVLFAVLFAGMGRGVRWNQPLPTPPLPEVRQNTMPVPLPLDHFAAVWQRPLFNPDRKAVLHNAGETSNLGDMELTGIIITPSLRVALLRNKSDDKTQPGAVPTATDNKDDASKDVRVREGGTLPDGSWKLVELQPRVAIFESGGSRSELKLPSGAPVTPLPNQKTAPPIPGQPNPGMPPTVDANGSPQMQIHHVGPGVPMPPGAVSPGQPAPPPADQAERIRQLRENILKRRAQQAATPNGVR